MIQIRQLTKRFGRTTVLNDVSFDVGLGESVALWGTNGAGKTTILRCITGLYDYKGSVTIDGLDAQRHGKRARQLIGYVPQDSGLYDDLRVGQAVTFFASLRGVRVEQFSEALARVGLADRSHQRVRELSGGMKQRLSLAIALLGEPPVLLLDEVTTSLDAIGRADLIGLLATLTRSDTRAMLFASHRVEEIAALATRVIVLNKGRIEQDLPVHQFVAQHAESTVLHLFMEPAAVARAMAALSRRGFSPRLNGQGILVNVQAGQRMKPLHILQEEHVAVSDFELLSREDAGRFE